MTYRIAGIDYTITAEGNPRSWQLLTPHFEPFIADAENDELPLGSLNMVIAEHREPIRPAAEPYFEQQVEKDEAIMRAYPADDGCLSISLQMPRSPEINALLRIDCRKGEARIDQFATRDAAQYYSLNTSLMLAYYLAGASKGILVTHSSAIILDGRCYLFLGRSGTGKSTHSRLWMETIPGAELLNDDHPILRMMSDGSIRAYGSPWSGKTDCYRNLNGQLTAIVRLRQAPFNRITPLLSLQAYAAVAPSCSGIGIAPWLTDDRHRSIERLISTVPCYLLECLPDHDAARLCHDTVTNSAIDAD